MEELRVERMELKEIMVQDVVTVESTQSAKEAARKMNLCGIGCLIVLENGKVSGILTERDLLVKVVETSKNAGRTRVNEIMSTKLIVATQDMEVVDAARLMLQKKIKKLPVVSDSKLVGLVTFTDIVRTVRMDPEMMNTIKDLTKSGWLPPKSMKHLLEFYIA